MTRQEAVKIGPERPALLVVAAPKEAEAIVRGIGVGDVDCRRRRWEAVELRPGYELVISGVGKSCAAGAVATVFDPARHGAILNLGVAGSLPVEDAPALGDAVLADQSVYADEGVESPDGFDDVASMGFSPAPPGFEAMGLAVPGDPGLIEALRHLADQIGPVATVSTCAGTDALAAKIATRTKAVAEAMEGCADGRPAIAAVGPAEVAGASWGSVARGGGGSGRLIAGSENRGATRIDRCGRALCADCFVCREAAAMVG